MDIVQVAGFVLQVMRFAPDVQDTGRWYRGAWERVCALFRRNRESTRVQRTTHLQQADTRLVLGARDNAIQLEEGLLQARVDDAEEIGGPMPGDWID